MIVHTAHLVCKPEYVEVFRSRLQRHAHTSLTREEGCRKFDIHQNSERPELFFLHEIYQDQAALEAHRASTHFLEFRKDTTDWVAERTWWFWAKLETSPE